MDLISSTDAKKRLESLIDSVNSEGEPPIIYNKQGNKAVLLSLDDFNSIQETLAMLSELEDDEDFEGLLEDVDLGLFREDLEPLIEVVIAKATGDFK